MITYRLYWILQYKLVDLVLNLIMIYNYILSNGMCKIT